MDKIDLISFLRCFYGIYHQDLNFYSLTHDDIKVLFPEIKTCNKKDVTQDDLCNGNVILVYDCFNKVKYYLNPHLNLDNVEIPNLKVHERVFSQKEICYEELENLSKDELLKIRRQLRLENRRKEAWSINKLIKIVKEKEPKDYRQKKMKLIKESIYD